MNILPGVAQWQRVTLLQHLGVALVEADCRQQAIHNFQT